MRATILDDSVVENSDNVSMNANRITFVPPIAHNSIKPASTVHLANTLIGSKPVTNTNDKTEAPDKTIQTLLPSLWWFQERVEELNKGDIGYFIPSPIE